jgi:hypothetical protein
MIVSVGPVSRLDAGVVKYGLEGRRNPRMKEAFCSTASQWRKANGKSLRLKGIKPDKGGSRLIAVGGANAALGLERFSERIKPNQSKSKRIKDGGVCFAVDCSTAICEEVIGSGRVSTGSGLIQVNPSKSKRMATDDGTGCKPASSGDLKSLLRKWRAEGCAGAINRQLTLEIPVKHATFRH